ncbi:MAG: hypothetical protein ACREI9_03435 [Nitrospiraceae bacterium]
MGWWVLFAGLVGVSVSLVVQWYWQRQKLRAEVALSTAGWLDSTYRCLNRMWVYKMSLPVSGGQVSENFRQDANDLGARLKSLEVQTSIELVHGEGDELRLVRELVQKMERASSTLVCYLKDDKPETTDKLQKDIEEIERLRKELLHKLVLKAGPLRLLNWKPTSKLSILVLTSLL